MPRKKPVPVVVEPEKSILLKNLLANPLPEDEVLASGAHRDTGVLARLSRHQLVQLIEEIKLVPHSIEGIQLPTEDVLKIARYSLGLELYKQNISSTVVDIHNRQAKYENGVRFILENHAARQSQAANKSAAKAQRRADTMAEETVATEETTTKGRRSKAEGKSPAKKAAKKVVAKAASSKKTVAEDDSADVSRYADDKRKIRVISKDNPHREGTNRASAFAHVIKSKTVSDYVAGGPACKPKYLDKWVEGGYIELGA